MSEEKPKASWPCPEQSIRAQEQLAASSIELGKFREKFEVAVAKHQALYAGAWQEIKESLSNLYPGQNKLIYGAVGLHYNEKEGTIESWIAGEGPFKSELDEGRQFPIMLNMNPDAGKDPGGTVIDKSSEILGEELGKKKRRDLDLGLDDDGTVGQN